MVAPATGVTPGDWPAMPCRAHHGGVSPVTFCRKEDSPLLLLMCSATS